MRRKYKYKIRKLIPRIELQGGYFLPETLSEVDLNHLPLFLSNPDIKPIGVLWLEILDNETGELLYRWPKQ